MLETNRNTCAVLFSGGLDSTTLLYQAIKDFGKENVYSIGFRYGSKHNTHELDAAFILAGNLGMLDRHRVINLEGVFEKFQSNLLKGGGDIPTGKYDRENLSLTVVPGRNLIFLSIAAGFCESQGIGNLWFGAHQNDSAVYPDCRPGFVSAVQKTIFESTEGRVELNAPFVLLTKTMIAKKGKELGVPFELTRSCYQEDARPCGKCATCTDRREALASIGVVE